MRKCFTVIAQRPQEDILSFEEHLVKTKEFQGCEIFYPYNVSLEQRNMYSETIKRFTKYDNFEIVLHMPYASDSNVALESDEVMQRLHDSIDFAHEYGVEKLTLWDFDTVDEHNITNQIYDYSDVKMLKIDVQSMKNHAEKLAKLVEQYEENTMILSREIQNSDTEWHDDNTETFFNKMEKQKGELKEFISNMNEVSTTYETIVDKTQKIKKNIKTAFVDQKYKSNIMSTYSKAINNLWNVRNRLNGQSIYFCTYYEKNLVRNAVYKLGNAAQSLENSKKKIENLFEKFSILENEISSLLSKIEIMSITEIDYSEYL